MFSANSEFIALGGDDRSVSVWRTASGQRERELANLDSSIHSLSFSPDGNWVAVGNGSGTIELFDRRRANRSTLFMGHTSAVHGLAFSNNGKRLYSAGGFDKRIGSWNTENLGGIKRNVEHLEGWIGKHKDSVLALAVSKNGQQLVVGGYDKSMQVWDLQTEKPIAQFNTNGETIRELQFFGNDTKIISAADDGFVRVWDVKTQTQSGAIAASVGAVRSFSIHPDGTKLAVSGADKQVSTWDFQAALQSMSK